MLKIALAQDDFLVGHITGNRDRILEAIQQARDHYGADLILFPELALTGYPPEDLLLRPGFMRRTEDLLDELASEVHGIDVIVGHPRCGQGETRYNSVSWLRDGQILATYDKWDLPNYAVFDERRYFDHGDQPLVVEVKGVRVGVVICEDAWTPEPCKAALDAGAQVILSSNASPFYRGKQADRSAMLAQRHRDTGLPLIYLNCVGGQDELVFDGHSLYIDGQGRISPPAPLCRESLLLLHLNADDGSIEPAQWPVGDTEDLPVIYQVLQRGLRDYV